MCIEPAQPRNGRPTGTHSTRQSVLTPKRLPPLCVCRAGDAAAARERTVLPDAMQWLWIWCRPVGYRQHGLGRQLSQAGAQSPLLCAPTSTGMACVCAVALHLVQAGRVSSARTRTAAAHGRRSGAGCCVCYAGAAAAAALTHASRSCHRRQKAAAVCVMRVLRPLLERADGAARSNAVALVLM